MGDRKAKWIVGERKLIARMQKQVGEEDYLSLFWSRTFYLEETICEGKVQRIVGDRKANFKK